MDRARTPVRLVLTPQAPVIAPSAATQVSGHSCGLPTDAPNATAFPQVKVPRAFNSYLAEPLPQRPAGSIGKRGRCSLAFAVRGGKTHLQQSFVSHPFHVTHPWHLDPALPNMAVVYVQTPTGGLIQGDRAVMQFALEPSAQVHITTQAAEKIHMMTANCATQQVTFTLAANAYAEYCPEPVILFPGSRFAQEVYIELGLQAGIFFSEIFLIPAGMELFTALSTGLTIREVSGTILLHERGLAMPAQRRLDRPGILGGHRVWGQAVFSGPQVPSRVIQELAALIADQSEAICGVSSLPRERGIVVKVVSNYVPAVRQALHSVWNFLRFQWLQVPAPVFPK